MRSMKYIGQMLLLMLGMYESIHAVPPVLNYAGQVTVNGKAFDGYGLFKFALVNTDGTTTYWSNDGTSVDGSEPGASVSVPVNGGLYSILLGNTAQQGMEAIDPAVFVQHTDAKLRVWFRDGVNGFQQLSPDRPFASVPYAFSAVTAQIANSVNFANGSISKQMLAQDVLSDLNRPITRDMLSLEVRNDLNRTLTGSQIENNSITTAQLSEQVLKYLKPEVKQPSVVSGMIVTGQSVTIQSTAEGKFLTYQWFRNGQPITGATGEKYVIDDADKSLHDGNYSVAVSNDFGSVTTQAISLEVQNYHTVASVGIEMIWCPPGTFMMGSPSSEAGREADETQHQVTLTHGFYLGKYEVTQAQYETVMTGNAKGLNDKPSKWLNNTNRPVEQVSWNDVQVFLSRLNDMQEAAGRLPAGWKYVLPTEAQWEYACRAGTTTKFYWGNDINSSNANYNWDQAWNTGNDFKQTRDVGMYDPNPWGFFDMIGNVSEWVNNWWAVYPGFSQSDPEGSSSGSIRVKRGGNWGGWATLMRIADRAGDPPNVKLSTLGFRLAFRKIQPDTANPEIQLIGGNTITHSQGIPFTDPGVEAHDVRDGNITDQIVVTGSVDMNSTGTYLLTYTVQDGAGNTATATRTVTVVGNRTVDLNATVAMDMIWCPPGTFTMGSPTTEAGRETDETEHNVSLTRGFYLGKYEVTQAQYQAVMTGNANSLSADPSQFKGGNRPVEKVSWGDAQVFLTRLNEQQAGNLPSGWSYVLPTESQWEYACRAGTTTAYSWGDGIASTNANYAASGYSQTRDVGLYAANPWGFFDMHGNIREWTADWYQTAYPTGNPVVDPTGPASGSHRILRSGSYQYGGGDQRSAKRYKHDNPDHRGSSIGFRISLQKSQ